MFKLTIELNDIRTAEHFLSWFSGSGEQSYWEWMEYRESEEKGAITILDFNYNKENLRRGLLKTTCGRRSYEE